MNVDTWNQIISFFSPYEQVECKTLMKGIRVKVRLSDYLFEYAKRGEIEIPEHTKRTYLPLILGCMEGNNHVLLDKLFKREKNGRSEYTSGDNYSFMSIVVKCNTSKEEVITVFLKHICIAGVDEYQDIVEREVVLFQNYHFVKAYSEHVCFSKELLINYFESCSDRDIKRYHKDRTFRKLVKISNKKKWVTPIIIERINKINNNIPSELQSEFYEISETKVYITPSMKSTKKQLKKRRYNKCTYAVHGVLPDNWNYEKFSSYLRKRDRKRLFQDVCNKKKFLYSINYPFFKDVIDTTGWDPKHILPYESSSYLPISMELRMVENVRRYISEGNVIELYYPHLISFPMHERTEYYIKHKDDEYPVDIDHHSVFLEYGTRNWIRNSFDEIHAKDIVDSLM